jgi:predicted metal-dependent HD superfamily phosphohydrolase
MLRAVGRRCSTGSATVLGDLAQATTPWASRSWADALGHLGKAEAHIEQLTRGFRVPGEVIEYAARLLPVIAPGLEPPTSVRRTRGELAFTAVTPETLVHQVGEVAEAARARVGSVGLIAPDVHVPAVLAQLTSRGIAHAVLGDEPADPDDASVEFDVQLDVVPASLAKGLEFDHVVLLEPADIVAGEADRVTGLRRLYVCLTRAVTSLAVVHAKALPTELEGWWPTWLDEDLRIRLEEAYGGSGRGYHDLQHLREVLAHVDELMAADDPARETVLLAAWFHDAVYDGREDDEERSARLAEESLGGSPLGPEVARLVRLTTLHRPTDDDVAGQVLCDADLAILAAPPERYASYVAGVRAEYAQVPDADFAAGRAAVLHDLLDKRTLFHTPAARARWERAARANVRRELEQLEGSAATSPGTPAAPS